MISNGPRAGQARQAARLVAISGSYGAGGSWVGRQLAARLEVPFVDRAIPAAVAEALAVPLDDAESHDERMRASWLERMLSGFVGQDSGAPTTVPAETPSAADFRRATEEVLLRQAATGAGVILGRAAVVLLRERSALRVRLDGPAQRRLPQAMELEGIDEETAKRRMRELDRTHATYVKHFYGQDICDPTLYHVVLDSTSIELDACVEMLLLAARSIDLGELVGR